MPKNSLLPEYVRKVLESVILRFLITAKRLEKSPETDRFQDFSGASGDTELFDKRSNINGLLVVGKRYLSQLKAISLI